MSYKLCSYISIDFILIIIIYWTVWYTVRNLSSIRDHQWKQPQHKKVFPITRIVFLSHFPISLSRPLLPLGLDVCAIPACSSSITTRLWPLLRTRDHNTMITMDKQKQNTTFDGLNTHTQAHTSSCTTLSITFLGSRPPRYHAKSSWKSWTPSLPKSPTPSERPSSSRYVEELDQKRRCSSLECICSTPDGRRAMTATWTSNKWARPLQIITLSVPPTNGPWACRKVVPKSTITISRTWVQFSIYITRRMHCN